MAIHDEFVKEEGTGAGILNASALASCVEMPQMAVFGEECYKTIPQKAAAYGYFITKNHCFMDANHRTAFAAMDTFLRFNGYKMKVSFTHGVQTMHNVSAYLMDRESFIFWVQNNIVPLD